MADYERAIPIIDTDGSHLGGFWVCKACFRGIYQSPETAESCCAPRRCSDCSTLLGERSYRTVCHACWLALGREREGKRWAAATAVAADDHDGMIWVCDEYGNDIGSSDGWFSDTAWLNEWLEDEYGDDPPELHVYAGTPKKLRIDIADIVRERLYEQAHEEAPDEVDHNALDGLQFIVDEWCAAHSPTWYDQDFGRKIVGWEDRDG